MSNKAYYKSLVKAASGETLNKDFQEAARSYPGAMVDLTAGYNKDNPYATRNLSVNPAPNNIDMNAQYQSFGKFYAGRMPAVSTAKTYGDLYFGPEHNAEMMGHYPAIDVAHGVSSLRPENLPVSHPLSTQNTAGFRHMMTSPTLTPKEKAESTYIRNHFNNAFRPVNTNTYYLGKMTDPRQIVEYTKARIAADKRGEAWLSPEVHKYLYNARENGKPINVTPGTRFIYGHGENVANLPGFGKYELYQVGANGSMKDWMPGLGSLEFIPRKDLRMPERTYYNPEVAERSVREKALLESMDRRDAQILEHNRQQMDAARRRAAKPMSEMTPEDARTAAIDAGMSLRNDINMERAGTPLHYTNRGIETTRPSNGGGGFWNALREGWGGKRYATNPYPSTIKDTKPAMVVVGAPRPAQPRQAQTVRPAAPKAPAESEQARLARWASGSAGKSLQEYAKDRMKQSQAK